MIRYPLLWLAIFTHLLWGPLLLIDPSCANATALGTLHRIVGNTTVEGLLLTAVGLGTAWAMRRGIYDLKSFFAIIPQQTCLFVSAFGAAEAIIKSQYGDGVPRPWAFILADQWAWILVAILHAVRVTSLHFGEMSSWGSKRCGRS